MRSTYLLSLALVALTMPAFAQSSNTAQGDPAAGKDAFRPCSACHDAGPDPHSRMGPYLTGVVGRPAASVDGFTYSKAMIAARDAGLVWTPEALDAFLQGPREFVPGTKMPEVLVRDETARRDLIAYLMSVSPDFDPETQISTYTPPGGGDASAASAAPSSPQ